MSGVATHLPALVVVTPLLGGVLAPLCGKGPTKAWSLATLVTWLTFAWTCWLAAVVHDQGTVQYYVGTWGLGSTTDWSGVVGIELRVDRLNALILCLVAGMTAVITPYARLSVAKEVPHDRLHMFYAVWQLCLTGLLGITVTGDAFNLYVLIEISSLTTYILVALGKRRDKRALTAALRYLFMGTVGASFLLLGVGYLFMATGTLNMGEMAVKVAELRDTPTVRTAFAFVLAGLSLKMALFPVHQWLPKAYAYSPSAVSAFLASTATKVGIYGAFRFLFTVFGTEFSFGRLDANALLIACSCLAILYGSLVAIRQRDLKRLLAYSSVAQVGYMVLGLALANREALTGTLVHMVNHALVKGAMFLAVGCMIYRLGSARVEDLQGLGKRMPLTTVCLVVGCLGLVGVPLTGGFISKWYLVQGALEAGMWPVAVVLLVGSLLAVLYAMRIVEPIVFGKAPAGEEVREAPPSMLLPTAVLLVGSLVLGVSGSLNTSLIWTATGDLLGVGQ
ncbi:MAG: monovalent cation/H+ antiporter subunit D family protein [Planctomycetota bacterium]